MADLEAEHANRITQTMARVEAARTAALRSADQALESEEGHGEEVQPLKAILKRNAADKSMAPS